MRSAEFAHIAMSALAAGGMVLFAAAYAILFALGRSRANRRLEWSGYGAYAALVGCALVVAHALQLRGAWLWLIAGVLVGYLLVPRFIWRLTLAVHESPASSQRDDARD